MTAPASRMVPVTCAENIAAGELAKSLDLDVQHFVLLQGEGMGCSLGEEVHVSWCHQRHWPYHQVHRASVSTQLPAPVIDPV